MCPVLPGSSLRQNIVLTELSCRRHAKAHKAHGHDEHHGLSKATAKSKHVRSKPAKADGLSSSTSTALTMAKRLQLL